MFSEIVSLDQRKYIYELQEERDKYKKLYKLYKRMFKETLIILHEANNEVTYKEE